MITCWDRKANNLNQRASFGHRPSWVCQNIRNVYIRRFCIYPTGPWTCTNCFRDRTVDWFHPGRRNSPAQSIT
jgi:hypothetical protein